MWKKHFEVLLNYELTVTDITIKSIPEYLERRSVVNPPILAEVWCHQGNQEQ